MKNPFSPYTSNDVGLVLTRGGYYTEPPLSELETRMEEGRCEVENFTVGRRGFGNVCFLGVTDVAGLDLDSLGVCTACILHMVFREKKW